MTRRTRLLAAVTAAAALLFSQLAVSAYICPMAAPGMEAASAQDGCDEAMVDLALCHSHCDYGSASVDAAKPLQALPVAIPASLKVALPDIATVSSAAQSPHVASGPSPPPPLSRFTVLRI